MTFQDSENQYPVRSTPATPDHGDAGTQQQAAQTLVELARRMDAVLTNLWNGMRDALEHCEQIVAREAQLQKQAAVLHQQQREWEQTHQQKLEKIRLECQRLDEAWTRLENYNRDKLTGNSESPQQNPTPETSSPEFGGMDPMTRLSVIEADVASIQSDTPVSEESDISMMQQFQQLKRDIGKHTRRKH